MVIHNLTIYQKRDYCRHCFLSCDVPVMLYTVNVKLTSQETVVAAVLSRHT